MIDVIPPQSMSTRLLDFKIKKNIDNIFFDMTHYKVDTTPPEYFVSQYDILSKRTQNWSGETTITETLELIIDCHQIPKYFLLITIFICCIFEGRVSINYSTTNIRMS